MRTIRYAEYEELQAVSDLMRQVFNRSMRDAYAEEGRSLLESEMALSSLQGRFHDTSLFYLCCENDVIEAVLEWEKPSHIAFLCVKEELKGRGRLLCEKFFDDLEEEVVTVGAFSKAVGFYERLGFVKISDVKRSDAVPFTLMAKRLPAKGREA